MKRILLILILTVVIIFFCTEIIIRVAGYKPYSFKTRPWQVAPRFFLTNDSALGFKPDTGQFTFTIGERICKSTHDFHRQRITSFNDTTSDNTVKPSISFLGGTNIYGFALNDEETTPFIFQNMFPQLKVKNLAVPGYGVASNYVLLTQRTNIQRGDIFIFLYFNDHDNRPSLKLQKGTYADIKAGIIKIYPTLSIDSNLQAHLNNYDYKLWRMNQYSALINYAEDCYNMYADAHSPMHETAKKAVLALHEYCRTRGATFVLVGRRSDAITLQMIDYCKKNGVPALHLPLDDNNFNPGKKDKNAEKKVFCDKLMEYLVHEKIVSATPALN